MTVWSSTQNVDGVGAEFAQAFNLAVDDVTALTEVMGGGFGSKFGADSWGIAAAHLAKKAGKPVKLFLDRTQEHTTAGNRPSTEAKITLAADEDGKLFGDHRRDPRHRRDHQRGQLPAALRLQRAEQPPDAHRRPRQRRQPRHAGPGPPPGLRHDGVGRRRPRREARRRPARVPPQEPGRSRTWSRAARASRSTAPRSTEKEIELGTAAIGWGRRKSRAENAEAKGPIKRSLGMALHQWGGGGRNDKQVDLPDQSRRHRRAADRHPGHRHRLPDRPGPDRRRGPRPDPRT